MKSMMVFFQPELNLASHITQQKKVKYKLLQALQQNVILLYKIVSI